MKERVEVRAHWGDELLDVDHVTPSRAAELAGSAGPLRYEICGPVVIRESFGPAQMDRAPWLYVGATLVFAGLCLVAAAFLPPSHSMLSLERNALASRRVGALVMEERSVEVVAPVASLDGTTPIAAQGDPGRSGERRASAPRRRHEASGDREHDEDHGVRARDVGALAALRSMQGSWESSSPFAGTAGGNDALASLMGDRIGDSFGFGGLTLSSTGRGAGVEGGTQPLEPTGGGGTGSGSTCGCAGMPSILRGSGTGLATARAIEPELRERESRVPRRIVRCGCAHLRISGGLSREVIRRVVRRHHAEVRHCYEGGLQTRPELAGRVLMRFTIAPSGEVVASLVESSTLGHARTEMCIAAAVRHWSFPAAEGGITNVSYPFVLESL